VFALRDAIAAPVNVLSMRKRTRPLGSILHILRCPNTEPRRCAGLLDLRRKPSCRCQLLRRLWLPDCGCRSHDGLSGLRGAYPTGSKVLRLLRIANLVNVTSRPLEFR
jgi:hypothetical protein